MYDRAPQNDKLKHWNLIDYVGLFDNIQNDTKSLLQRVGAWKEFGSNGWGVNGTEAIFGTSKTAHATESKDKFDEFYTKEIERKVEERYAIDYKNEVIAMALSRSRKRSVAR